MSKMAEEREFINVSLLLPVWDRMQPLKGEVQIAVGLIRYN